MQNVFNCLDELKRFKEIPPNTIVIEERNGKTVVLVSHRESTMRIADKIYSVEHGRMS